MSDAVAPADAMAPGLSPARDPERQRQARLAALADQPLKPVGPPRGALAGAVASVRSVWQYRELLQLLVRREVRARYKNSTLGFAWSLLKPIAQLAVYFLIVGEVLGVARGIPDFGIFVFSGLVLWGLFNEIVSGGTGSVVANSGLVKKVYFPREIFPLSTVGSALVNFGIQVVVLFIGTVLVGAVPFTPTVLYVVPAVLLVVVLGLALATLLGALNVYLRDIQHLVEIVILLLFWASPIVYSYSYVNEYLGGGWIEQVYLSNPVTIAIMAFQKGVWLAGADQPFPADLPLRLGIALLASLVLLWVAQRLFARLEGNFAQEL
ncbi:ABC transporter permease [Actinotalea sp. Marseille-Q4924]|uniref:ABC transporter permease n=1 Tax=Actinotalea sp. Marseille-Q4924 TaxID=2866571 RepID=UPI001CE3CE8B|nr:ABC transporter permease [Actinotalea sp. Marseille-Q4924]